MNLIEIKNEIERMIRATPYSREEVLEMFDKEEEYSPDELMAYSVAIEYLKGKKSADRKRLEKMFTKRKKELVKYYKDR